MIWLVIALGAAVGAPARYLTDAVASRRRSPTDVPWGTILVNVAGSLLLGVMAGAMTTANGHELVYAAVGTGFCGAFTTFSTFTWETLALAEDGCIGAAAANLLLSLGLGLGAAAAGYALT